MILFRKPDFNVINDHSTDQLHSIMEVEILTAEEGKITSRMPVLPKHLSPLGKIHAAAIIALADTTCGFGTHSHLPEGAASFVTIELKSNFLGTVSSGILYCEAILEHQGRSTQVWDAIVKDGQGKKIALFRCSQIILYRS